MRVKMPMDVVCPNCRAAIGAKCTIKIKDGMNFVDSFCKERQMLADDSNTGEIFDHAS